MNKLQAILNDVARKATSFQERGMCWLCESEAAPKIHTEAGRREFQISGTCEECFDDLFKE